MYGLEAISAANGWAMAVVGALIVFTGLVLLSLVISQLPKFLPFLEKRGAAPPVIDEPLPPSEKQAERRDKSSADLKEQAALFEPLIEELGSDFPLADLYGRAKEHNIPHPHLSISAFRDAGILAPLGDGVFTWNKDQLIAACKKGD